MQTNTSKAPKPQSWHRRPHQFAVGYMARILRCRAAEKKWQLVRDEIRRAGKEWDTETKHRDRHRRTHIVKSLQRIWPDVSVVRAREAIDQHIAETNETPKQGWQVEAGQDWWGKMFFGRVGWEIWPIFAIRIQPFAMAGMRRRYGGPRHKLPG